VAVTGKNQTPEQEARDNIDRLLEEAGWKVQDNKKINFNAGPGIAVREYRGRGCRDAAQHAAAPLLTDETELRADLRRLSAR